MAPQRCPGWGAQACPTVMLQVGGENHLHLLLTGVTPMVTLSGGGIYL